MGRSIEELIESAKNRYNLGYMFVKEIETLIDLGVVNYTGGNMWNVDGYEVNQFTKTCTCPTNYTRNEKVGKMCPHVFAMTVMRLYQEDNPKQRISLDEIMQKDGLRELRIEWDYESPVRTVIGYIDRNGTTRLKSDEKIVVDYSRVDFMLRKYGYSLSEVPHKLEGSLEYIYQYKIQKGKGVPFTENIWNTRSVTTSSAKKNNMNAWAAHMVKGIA